MEKNNNNKKKIDIRKQWNNKSNKNISALWLFGTHNNDQQAAKIQQTASSSDTTKTPTLTKRPQKRAPKNKKCRAESGGGIAFN